MGFNFFAITGGIGIDYLMGDPPPDSPSSDRIWQSHRLFGATAESSGCKPGKT